MIRLRPLVAEASELMARPVARGPEELREPARGPWFWVALWLGTLVASFVALIPALFGHEPPVTGYEVVHTVSGISFATCGLVAWRRRPDSRIGVMLTLAGFGVLFDP